MGLKFRPSLRPPSVAQFDLQIKDFCRRVRLQDKFANCLQDTDFNPRVRKELRDNIAVNLPHWNNNLTKQEREELQELKSNPNIKVLPTDKNLGPALLSTDWV